MRNAIFVKRPVVQVALTILLLAVVAVVFIEVQDHAWATSGPVTYNALHASSAVTETYHTLKVYGGSGWPELPGNVGAGSGIATDEVSGHVVLIEDQPYTDTLAIFNPQLPQAPRKDSITWNPLFMSELETPDENDAKGLYHRLIASGINASEKVWFRMWYEPEHWDKDLNANGKLDRDPITGVPTGADEWYPAIMQEFTYLLMELDEVADKPEPTHGEAGTTNIVFPVGMRWEDIFDPYGYGLTSLDGNFDGTPDIVHVASEHSLQLGSPSITVDFDGDGIEDLDTDGVELSGDELVVFHLDILEFPEGGCVQFLDHMACLDKVLHGAAKLNVWYIGNRVPVGPTPVTVSAGSAFLVDHAWFAYLDTVNVDDKKAWLMVGRALGATHSAMENPDTWFLKRFYVDGHEYNVVAIKTHDHTGFKFITIRTPIPKTEVPHFINQHSVYLQNYLPEDPLSVMPPYNYQHYIIEDIQSLFLPEYYPDYVPGFAEDEDEVDYLGKLVGPVPPILQENVDLPYQGAYTGYPGPYYDDPRELYLRYVREDANPQFLGELKEKYGEITGTTVITEFWYVEQWWTRPWEYTEFVLPDISDDITEAASVWDPNGSEPDPDLYLLTSAFTAPQAEYLYWIQDVSTPLRYNLSLNFDWEHDEGEDTITSVLPGWKPRVKFWFDPAVGGRKYKAQGRLRLYGRGNEGAGDTAVLTDTVSTGLGTAPVEVPPYTDPWAPFNPQLPQAPRKDSLTFNPALMAMDSNGDEPLAALYNQLKIEGDDAQEKVFFRMWHEPEYLDKVRKAEIVGDVITATQVFTFPALLQEFTYMYLDYNGQPSHAQPGNPPLARTLFAFPMGTAADELPTPITVTLPSMAPDDPARFGYGLTTFDADFDGSPDPVTIHSERTLSETTGIQADFDGNGFIDQLDTDGVELSGDELVIFAVESIDLGQYQSAMFLDFMVTLRDVTWDPAQPTRAVLKFWYTGGTISDHSIPKTAVESLTLEEGEMAVFLKDFPPQTLSAGEDNLGDTDGAWFVYIQGLNYAGKTAVLTIGRALGATHSAIDDGAGKHDMTPGDPWYLKRFFVDGHEYNVVAIKTVLNDEAILNTGQITPTNHISITCATIPYFVPQDKEWCWEFKYITIRTPVPKVNFVNTEDSIKLQGYHEGTVFGVNSDIISVMPPFNYRHTRVHDIQKLEEGQFADSDSYVDGCVGDWKGNVDSLEIWIKRQCDEMQFFGELKEKYWEEDDDELWATEQFHMVPYLCTELELPAGQLYLLTSDWESDQSWVHYYGCDPTNDYFTQDELHGLHPSIPEPNAVITFTGPITNSYYSGPLRVKFWHDPEDPDDLYVGTWVITPTCVATASSNSPVCEGGTIQLYGDPDGMASYRWVGPGGWTSSLQNPPRSGATTDMAGSYTLTVTDTHGCSDSDTTDVIVYDPGAYAYSNSPVPLGGTIELYGGPGGMASYRWVGPDSWTSSLQNPTRTVAITTMVGIYTLTVTDTHGCSDSDTTYVSVGLEGQQGYLVPQHSNAPYCITTTVSIWVNGTSFKSGQIKLAYNSTCADVTGWALNTANFPTGTWDSTTPGEEWITFYATEPMTGTYRIGNLTIHCKSQDGCTTDLDFVEDGPMTTKLFNEWGSELPSAWQDGSFRCGVGMCGDVAPYPGCNGEINMGDVGLLHSYVGHPGDYSLCCEWCGDVAPYPSCNGEINMGDVSLLHSYVGHPGQYHLCCEGVVSATVTSAVSLAAAEVNLDPPNSSASFGETADVDIRVNATDLKAGQIKLRYDSACANVAGLALNTAEFPMGEWHSATPGEEWITFSALEPMTGTYRIGTLTIHAAYEEGCATILDFVEEEPRPSKLFDDWGNEIPATWTDGTFRSVKTYEVYLPLVMKNSQ